MILPLSGFFIVMASLSGIVVLAVFCQTDGKQVLLRNHVKLMKTGGHNIYSYDCDTI